MFHFQLQRIWSLWIVSALIFSGSAPAWAIESKRPLTQRAVSKFKNSVSLAKKGITAVPMELRAAWTFQKAISSNKQLQKVYRAEKKKRHTGITKFATWSSWAAAVTNGIAMSIMPGTQPFHAFATGIFGAAFFQHNFNTGRSLEAARVDTIRHALRNNQQVDQKILAFYGQFLVGATKKDLAAAKSSIKSAEDRVQGARQTYKQNKLKVQTASRLTKWLAAARQTKALQKLNVAKKQRQQAKTQAREFQTELGQLIPRFTSN